MVHAFCTPVVHTMIKFARCLRKSCVVKDNVSRDCVSEPTRQPAQMKQTYMCAEFTAEKTFLWPFNYTIAQVILSSENLVLIQEDDSMGIKVCGAVHRSECLIKVKLLEGNHAVQMVEFCMWDSFIVVKWD